MVREQEVMTLSGRDRKAFVAALLRTIHTGSQASQRGTPLHQGDGPVNGGTTGLATVPY